MKNIKLIFILLIIAIFTFSYKNKYKEITLKNINLENIKFLDVIDNKKILFTKCNETFIYETKIEKIDKTIIDKLSNNYIYKENGKVGLLDKNLQKILGASYDNIFESNLENRVIIKNKNTMYLYNLLTHTLSKPYDNITVANKIGLLKVIANGKFGYINKNSKEVIPLEYDFLFDFKGDKCIAKKNDGWGIIYKNNIPLTKFDNQEVYLHQNGNWILKNKNGIYIDSEERELKNIILFPTISNYIIYKENNNFGIFNLEKLEKINKLYKEIGIYISKGMIVSDGNKFDIVPPLNIIEPNYRYDYVIQIDNDVYGIGSSKNGKVKFFTSMNFHIEEKEFEEIQKLTEELYGCIDDDKIYFYNENGKFILVTKLKNVLFFNKEFIVYKSKDNYKILNFKDF